MAIPATYPIGSWRRQMKEGDGEHHFLFEHGADAISGTRVVDVPAVLQAVGQGATFRQIPGKRLLTMMR